MVSCPATCSLLAPGCLQALCQAQGNLQGFLSGHFQQCPICMGLHCPVSFPCYFSAALLWSSWDPKVCLQFKGVMGELGLIARLCLVSPRPGRGPVGMSDAAFLLLPFAVCALLPPALPADGCLSPPELCRSHPGLGCTACTLPGLCSQPTAKRGSTGWERKPSQCPTTARSWAAGVMA